MACWMRRWTVWMWTRTTWRRRLQPYRTCASVHVLRRTSFERKSDKWCWLSRCGCVRVYFVGLPHAATAGLALAVPCWWPGSGAIIVTRVPDVKHCEVLLVDVLVRC